MNTATDNPPQGGTDSAQPQATTDNPADWDYYDPDDEKPQDNVAPKKATGTEARTAESVEPDVQEADGDEPQDVSEDAEAPDEQGDKPEAAKAVKPITDDVIVSLKDGTQVSVAELRDGYMRQSHFTRERQRDAQRAAHIQSVSERIENFLGSQIPPPPDPRLAYDNPAVYSAQLAQHEAARRQWESVTQVGQEAREAAQSFSVEEHQEAVEQETARLIERIPRLADPKAKEEFTKKAIEVAAQAGVSEQELRSVMDHRHLVILDWAAKGLAAERARAIAKQKTAAAPPVTAPKRQAINNPAVTKNRDAVRKLSQSGSIHDAMNVDFD